MKKRFAHIGSYHRNLGDNIALLNVRKEFNNQYSSIEWYSLERSNKINLHPLYYAIYGDIVYHHWAGSRNMITRPDRKRSNNTGESLDEITKENHEMSKQVFQQLQVQPDEFINYLKGNYQGELE